MKIKSFVYDGSSDGLSTVVELLNSNTRILCPVCGTDLIVALDHEAANKYQVHPGIYCPINLEHMFQMMELKGKVSFWEEFAKIKEEILQERRQKEAEDK